MSTPLATLSMYDWPEVSCSIDALWDAIQHQLALRDINAPIGLTRNRSASDLWHDPNLIVGQTCGWPYANKLRETVIPFARFDYGLEDCPAGHYNSVFIGNQPDQRILLKSAEALLSAKAIAVNSDDSQSGFRVFGEILGKPPKGLFEENQLITTGAHRNSLLAIAKGDAEIAAIDSVAFELAKSFEPEAVSQVHLIGKSQPKPGLPLITSKANGHLSKALLEAVTSAVEALDTNARSALHIKNVIPASDEEYKVFAES